MRHSFTEAADAPGYYYAMVDDLKYGYLIRGQGFTPQVKLKAKTPVEAAKNLRQRMELGSVQVVLDPHM